MKRTTVARPPRWQAVAVALGTGLLAVACSSGSTTASSGAGASSAATSAAASPAAPSPTSVLCQDAAALRTSLGKLTHMSVNKGAANEIKSNLMDVQSKLTTLTTDAKGQWQSQTSDLKNALAKLKTATSDLASSPGVSTVSGVVTALGGVTSAASSLLAAISTKCPSASPSA
jgi:VCBS repeat-containing protein